jgi:hypothetical protein
LEGHFGEYLKPFLGELDQFQIFGFFERGKVGKYLDLLLFCSFLDLTVTASISLSAERTKARRRI